MWILKSLKLKYKSSKQKKAERLMFRAGVKWHQEGEKNKVQDSQADGGPGQHYQGAE